MEFFVLLFLKLQAFLVLSLFTYFIKIYPNQFVFFLLWMYDPHFSLNIKIPKEKFQSKISSKHHKNFQDSYFYQQINTNFNNFSNFQLIIKFKGQTYYNKTFKQMKKVPSYPKITTKTNITFTQTQNININSPKSLAFSANGLSANKMFKAATNNLNKISRQRQKSNNSYVNIKSNERNINQKSKSKILSSKGSKSTTQLLIKRQNSTGNLKLSKNFDASQNSVKNQQKKNGGKQQIKKLEQKLKLLQRKIDTLKSSASKRKKQSSASQRSKSKVKQSNSTVNISTNNFNNDSHKQNIYQFQKIKSTSNDQNQTASTKILKKSYSDKNMIKSRPPKMPSPKLHQHPEQQEVHHRHKQQIESPEIHSQQTHNQKKSKNKNEDSPIKQQQIIHKFVTQVEKNPKMVQKHHHSHQQKQKRVFYYISNLSLSLKNNDYQIYKEHLVQSIQTLMYLQNIRKPSLKELEKHSVNLHAIKKHKYTIVLDLDETLIHCNETTDVPFDVSLKIKFPTGQKIDAGVNIRPYAIQLLKQLSQFCQIIVFTASHECYANVVLDHLDPHKKLISYRLYRTHCWQTQQGIYIKDLRILKNRDLQNVLLVDNAAYSYFYQLQNGIPIIPFYDDKQDYQLPNLIKYIKTLIKIKQSHVQHNTLKKANHHYFKLTQYVKYNDLQKLTKQLYEQNTIKDFESYVEQQNK